MISREACLNCGNELSGTKEKRYSIRNVCTDGEGFLSNASCIMLRVGVFGKHVRCDLNKLFIVYDDF